MQFDANAKMKQRRLGTMGRVAEDLEESQWTLCGDAWGKRGSEKLWERHMCVRCFRGSTVVKRC